MHILNSVYKIFVCIFFNGRWVLENACEWRGYTKLLKCKIHLHLRDSIRGYLYYAIVEFKVQIYIYITLLKITLEQSLCKRCLARSSHS
jgi:hypothetical protein